MDRWASVEESCRAAVVVAVQATLRAGGQTLAESEVLVTASSTRTFHSSYSRTTI